MGGGGGIFVVLIQHEDIIILKHAGKHSLHCLNGAKQADTINRFILVTVMEIIRCCFCDCQLSITPLCELSLSEGCARDVIFCRAHTSAAYREGRGVHAENMDD